MEEDLKKSDDVTPVWNCEVTQINEEKKEAYQVGDKFGLICKGEKPIEGLSVPVVKIDKELMDHFKLSILDYRSITDTRLDLIATSYLVGKHQGLTADLEFSGHKKLRISGIDIEISSVIEKEEGVRPEPYPPWPPYKINYPNWLYFVGILTAVLIIGSLISLFFILYSRNERKLKLKKFDSPLGPYGAFNKEIRQLMRAISDKNPDEYSTDEAKRFISKVKDELNLYFVRQFKIPAHVISAKKTIKSIKRANKKVYLKMAPILIKNYDEFSKTLNANKVTYYDCIQLAEMTKDVVRRVNDLINPRRNQ